MANTGFLVNMGGGNPSVCAVDSVHAIQALGARFPYVAGSQPLLCNLANSVFTAPNIFNNTVTCHDLTGSQSYSYTHPLTLMSCDPAFPVGGGTVFDPVVGAAFWSFSMTFIFGVFLISKNASMILSAIKRF